ncbi:hypothetical protein TNCV_1593621 [Trichonephila clavipes]|nr:hypothetical protein TNCV_1593621 [Trichonephila clavipes]
MLSVMTVVLPQHSKLAASSTTAPTASTSTPSTSTTVNTKSAIRPSAPSSHCQIAEKVSAFGCRRYMELIAQ